MSYRGSLPKMLKPPLKGRMDMNPPRMTMPASSSTSIYLRGRHKYDKSTFVSFMRCRCGEELSNENGIKFCKSCEQKERKESSKAISSGLTKSDDYNNHLAFALRNSPDLRHSTVFAAKKPVELTGDRVYITNPNMIQTIDNLRLPIVGVIVNKRTYSIASNYLERTNYSSTPRAGAGHSAFRRPSLTHSRSLSTLLNNPEHTRRRSHTITQPTGSDITSSFRQGQARPNNSVPSAPFSLSDRERELKASPSAGLSDLAEAAKEAYRESEIGRQFERIKPLDRSGEAQGLTERASPFLPPRSLAPSTRRFLSGKSERNGHRMERRRYSGALSHGVHAESTPPPPRPPPLLLPEPVEVPCFTRRDSLGPRIRSVASSGPRNCAQEPSPQRIMAIERVGASMGYLKCFPCEKCGKSFRSSSELKRHSRVHTNERPFACDICNARFKQKSHVKAHRLSIHHVGSNQKKRRRSRG